MLEVEIGVVGGEEDGVAHDINEKLYTAEGDFVATAKALGLGEKGVYLLAATFGNVHGVYKPGNVKLRPEILKQGQDIVAREFGSADDKPFNLVFHGGSGSAQSEIREALSYGVVKMNVDTDTQYAFTRPIVGHMFSNYDGVRPRDTRTEVGPHAMANLLAMADGGEHRQHRFHEHARVPGPTRTDCQVDGITRLRMETRISQDNHLALNLGHPGLKMRIVAIGGGTIPGTDQAPLVQDAAEFSTDHPPMIPLAFLPDLRRAAPFPPGVDPLAPLGVRHAQHGGGSQKLCGPCRVRLEEPRQAGALGHLRKPGQRVARQPAGEGAGPPALDRTQQGQGDHLTGREFGVRVLRDVQHLLVHRREQCNKKILGSPTTGSSWLQSSQPQLEPVCDYLSTPTLDITYQTNTIG